MKPTLLIVEDDDGLRPALERSASRRGYEVFAVANVKDACALLVARDIDIVLADMRLPNGSGLTVLKDAQEVDPEIRVILMTAFPEVKTAVDAMKRGAHDFIVKPFELEEVHVVLERAREAKALRQNLRRLERDRPGVSDLSDMLGSSEAIAAVRRQIERVAATDTPVLLTGETGTGKEIAADAVHAMSDRRAGPLVKVNCSAIAPSLLESELFGHDKGAFTNADQAREGLFEMADDGTLFLDEIGEMAPELQSRLLRVVERKPFQRVGGRRDIHADVRIIAATHRDLPAEVKAGRFREDLYFRLNVFQIELPALRARGGDVVEIARKLLPAIARQVRHGTIALTSRAEQLLLGYPWPGNVRELRNILERAVILSDMDVVDAEHLPTELRGAVPGDVAGELLTLKDVEERHIHEVMKSVSGNISEAARILGVARNTLKARLRRD